MWHEETRSNSFVPGQKTCIFRIVKFQLFIKMNEMNSFSDRSFIEIRDLYFQTAPIYIYHKVLAYVRLQKLSNTASC